MTLMKNIPSLNNKSIRNPRGIWHFEKTQVVSLQMRRFVYTSSWNWSPVDMVSFYASLYPYNYIYIFIRKYVIPLFVLILLRRWLLVYNSWVKYTYIQYNIILYYIVQFCRLFLYILISISLFKQRLLFTRPSVK